ncbi:MAG TPA: proline dehydrogenase family protein [Acidobacteriota bacterium]|nr:proline dehydrogenase family protein [Acidobacteriota bacterium]
MNPIRPILLAMAGSPTWKRLLTGWSVTHRVVGRFIPGETLPEALEAVRQLNSDGMMATLNPLGENISNADEAMVATDAYVEILEQIAVEQLDCSLSLKLTLLGLDLNTELASTNLQRVLSKAAEHGNFVRIDMEGSEYVEATLSVCESLRHRFHNFGVVLQSYLRRTEQDVEKLVPTGTPLRIVKGAYNEPEDVAFASKHDVDRNFACVLDRLAADDARGVRVAIASHDGALVAHACELIDRLKLDGWEFQMLYGIGRPLQRQLVADGYSVRVYVSYGPSWYPWFMRRLAERPANVGFFLRHLFG